MKKKNKKRSGAGSGIPRTQAEIVDNTPTIHPMATLGPSASFGSGTGSGWDARDSTNVPPIGVEEEEEDHASYAEGREGNKVITAGAFYTFVGAVVLVSGLIISTVLLLISLRDNVKESTERMKDINNSLSAISGKIDLISRDVEKLQTELLFIRRSQDSQGEGPRK